VGLTTGLKRKFGPATRRLATRGKLNAAQDEQVQQPGLPNVCSTAEPARSAAVPVAEGQTREETLSDTKAGPVCDTKRSARISTIRIRYIMELFYIHPGQPLMPISFQFASIPESLRGRFELPRVDRNRVPVGAILLIIGTATGMAWGLTQSGFSRALASAMTGLPGGAATFIAVSILAFVVLGSVLEGIPAVVLFGPLLFPIARAVGVHEVHYAMIIILAMGVGLFAPPFGVGYYAACAIGRVDPADGIRPIWGYMLALLVGLVIVAIFPRLSIGFL
jgi:hypothetical protein